MCAKDHPATSLTKANLWLIHQCLWTCGTSDKNTAGDNLQILLQQKWVWLTATSHGFFQDSQSVRAGAFAQPCSVVQVVGWPQLPSPAHVSSAGLQWQRQGWILLSLVPKDEHHHAKTPSVCCGCLGEVSIPFLSPLQNKKHFHVFMLGKEGTQHISCSYAPIETTSHLNLVY